MLILTGLELTMNGTVKLKDNHYVFGLLVGIGVSTDLWVAFLSAALLYLFTNENYNNR